MRLLISETDMAGAYPDVEPEDLPARGSAWEVFSNSKPAVNACRVLVLAVVLLAWQFCAEQRIVNPTFASEPTKVWHALITYYQSGKMWSSTASTLEAVLVSFVIGTVAGTLAGFVLGLSPFADRVCGVFVVPLNSIPRIALAPLFLVWFGLGQTAKVALAITIVFFVMLINARSAVKSVDPDIATMARVVGLGRFSYLAKVLWPASVPVIFAGIRLSLTYALLGVIASEMIAGKSGLGIDITTFSNEFAIGGVFAVLLELVIISTFLNILLERCERWLLRWQETSA